MQRVLRILVALVGVLLALLGLQWMFAPGSTAEQFGIALTGLPGLSTARADLGGLFIASSAIRRQGLADVSVRGFRPDAISLTSLQSLGLLPQGLLLN